ncbi:MAG: glutathione S-transferase family protein [Gammaproteobacteria bacterium]|nr:glutathione S-transferase family protein [Gammaproteobacteria bacterium]MYF37269.1 glutathione S-transferase family protein [Gammaproteobacteria bacterium]
MLLFDQQHAPSPRRVRIFLAEKGIAYDRKQINIVRGENLSPEFLEINPRGRLPALVLDDGTVLDESVAICRYFEELYPDPPLMGTDALSKARIEARLRHVEFDGLLPASEVFRNAYPRFQSRAFGGNVGTIQAIPELVNRGKVLVSIFFKRLEAELNKSQYIAGEGFSIADIAALCTIDFATTSARIPFPDNYSALRSWYQTVTARPSTTA